MTRESFYQWMSKQVRDLRWLVYSAVVISVSYTHLTLPTILRV